MLCRLWIERTFEACRIPVVAPACVIGRRLHQGAQVMTSRHEEQVRTSRCSAEAIMQHPNFARGLDDIRQGRQFDTRIEDQYWAYERGRQFGAIAPLSMPLNNGDALNPVAVRLFEAAGDKGLIR